jgi:signal peptidase I
MEPTLLVGDYLFVSKFSYGYSRYSFPIDLPFIEGRIWEGVPERGDIAVFRPPREPETDYIKRVIGLPGDRIQMRDGVLYINDEAVKREPAGEWEGEEPFGAARQYRETLPNGVSYLTLDARQGTAGDNTRVFEVPPGHYFLMGDNRDNSQDSRFLEGPVGFVPAENLVGRAEIIFFSVDDAPAWAFWQWPWSVRPDRIFDTL